MRIEAEFVGVLVVVDFSGEVDNHGLLVGDAFEAVIDEVGYLNQKWAVLADEEFIHEAFGGRVFAGVEEDDFHHAFDADEMVSLFFVIVPGLGDAGVGGGHVDLAELDVLALLVVGAEHFHEPSALVAMDGELFDGDAFNEFFGHD